MAFISAALGLAAGLAAAKGISSLVGDDAQDMQTNLQEDLRLTNQPSGQLTDAEAQTAAKKRAYRSGILFTSPTGLNVTPTTSSAKLR